MIQDIQDTESKIAELAGRHMLLRKIQQLQMQWRTWERILKDEPGASNMASMTFTVRPLFIFILAASYWIQLHTDWIYHDTHSKFYHGKRDNSCFEHWRRWSWQIQFTNCQHVQPTGSHLFHLSFICSGIGWLLSIWLLHCLNRIPTIESTCLKGPPGQEHSDNIAVQALSAFCEATWSGSIHLLSTAPCEDMMARCRAFVRDCWQQCVLASIVGMDMSQVWIPPNLMDYKVIFGAFGISLRYGAGLGTEADLGIDLGPSQERQSERGERNIQEGATTSNGRWEGKHVELLLCNHYFYIFLAPPNCNPRCPTQNPNGDKTWNLVPRLVKCWVFLQEIP